MATVFGELKCPGCKLATRFAEDIEIDANETLLLLGSKVEGVFEGVFKTLEHSACDYCETEFPVYVHIREGLICAYENEERELTTSTVKQNSGLEYEKRKHISQFNETGTLSFDEQPYLPGETVKVKNVKWRVKESYKKENIEPDSLVRSQINTSDEYWYHVSDSKGNERWFQVVDNTIDNVKISVEPPIVKEHEALLLIDDKQAKSEIIFTKETDEYMTLTAIQMISGTSLLLHSRDEEGNIELEANIFAPTFEEAMDQLENIFAQDGLKA